MGQDQTLPPDMFFVGKPVIFLGIVGTPKNKHDIWYTQRILYVASHKMCRPFGKKVIKGSFSS